MVPALLALPEPASTDDGNHWFDGVCMLRCDGASRRVIYIGPIRVPGPVHGHLTCCGPCLARLHELTWDQALARDRAHLDRAARDAEGRHRHGTRHASTPTNAPPKPD